jgi:NAD(P)H-hydrate epimerase
MIPVSAQTLRKLDSMASASGLSTLKLMENAGDAIAKKAISVLCNDKQSRVAIFCGKGNNGGDGLVAARKLKKGGFDVSVYLLSKQNEIKNEAAVNLRSFLKLGAAIEEIISDTSIEALRKKLSYSLIIDALLGTGFSGSVEGILKKLIDLLNSSGAPILAVDVPSGLNATTGEINPTAIKANWTISFALPKKGFYRGDGLRYTGTLKITNIGFSEELLKKAVKYEEKNARP